MWNTGVPVLGVLLGPVTATAGPIITDNVAMILGPVVSAYLAHRALAVLVGPAVDPGPRAGWSTGSRRS